MKKILVVEDNSQHLADAQRIYASVSGVVFEYATTLCEAATALMNSTFDGIICDIFFPVGEEGAWKDTLAADFTVQCRPFAQRGLQKAQDGQGRGATQMWLRMWQQALEEIDCWHESGAALPCGLVMLEYAVANNIPIVFNSDRDGHHPLIRTIVWDCGTEFFCNRSTVYVTQQLSKYGLPCSGYSKEPDKHECKYARFEMIGARAPDDFADGKWWQDALLCVLLMMEGINGTLYTHDEGDGKAIKDAVAQKYGLDAV